jgi:hypothetical protein
MPCFSQLAQAPGELAIRAAFAACTVFDQPAAVDPVGCEGAGAAALPHSHASALATAHADRCFTVTTAD